LTHSASSRGAECRTEYHYIQACADLFTGTLETHAVNFDSAGGVTDSEAGLPLCDGGSSGRWLTHNYYHADGNGNITALMNPNDTLVASYRYDPYGNILAQSGGLADANVYRFSSKELHHASGLYYYGYRFYDPSLQRWINRDPLGDEASGGAYYVLHHARPTVVVSAFLRTFEAYGEANTYGFVLNNPVNAIDWLGLDGCGKDECNDYPPGVLRFICKHTPCDARSNCIRACLLEYWDQGKKKKYSCGLIAAHGSCWLGCALNPGFEP
jgi:RHS repeat-associated protein